VVRNPAAASNRTLPANPGPNQWDGLLTLAFRVPLQATSAQDVYSVTFALLAVDDTETRITESFEEQDTASIRRARARAVALGATTSTVLNGSPALNPLITDYPGQRQICGSRVAGPSGGATRSMNAPGAYVRIAHYFPGESVDSCATGFRTGAPARPTLTVPFPVTLRAMDRYGNVRTATVDTVSLTTTDPTAVVMTGPTALASGQATVEVRYNSYGNAVNVARGRRNTGGHLVAVSGASRTWTGNVGTAWADGGNWSPVGVGSPGIQDTAVIPGDRPNYPLLVQNTSIGGVAMVNGSATQPTVNVSSFDFSVNADISLSTNGTLGGTGRLILQGVASTVGGGLTNFDVRNLRVTGSYSASSNLNVTGGRIVVQGGRLRSTGMRIRVRPS
jgi:trimeric autotransporter adhesin